MTVVSAIFFLVVLGTYALQLALWLLRGALIVAWYAFCLLAVLLYGLYRTAQKLRRPIPR